LAHYEILEKIGSGGMGEVWVAEDTKLQRKVALKVLPSWTTGDETIRARFEREARAVAALNHPNIVTIHSVEEAGGVLFFTMELLEGAPLTRRLADALPLEEIFSLAIPLADAVGAAHRQGILHRDLKPENVMLTPDGTVKVLDFGLAKLKEPVSGAAEEHGSDASLTREGRILGTTAYMSPEQAEAKELSPASDVFALGIILYQMSTGKRPFSGSTTVSMISSILKDKPEPVTSLNQRMPSHLGRIVRRCLDKKPEHRYPTASDLGTELELLREELSETGAQDKERPHRRGAWMLPAAAVGLVLMTAAAVLGWLRPAAPPAGSPGAGVSQQTFQGGVETDPGLSPDGQFLLYAATSKRGDTDIFLQRVDGSNPINLTEDSDAFDGDPAFSPDGTEIAFRSHREGQGLYVMGATGEAARRLTDFGHDPAWAPDGTQIVFATGLVDTPLERWSKSELWVVDVATGEERRIYAGDAVQPAWSPDGARIAFWTAYVGEALSGQRDIGTMRPDGTDVVWLHQDIAVDWCPHWSADGAHLYFSSDRGGSMNLWRVPMDQSTGRTRGPAEPVTVPALWGGPFALAGGGGRLAYVARDERHNLMAVDFDPVKGSVSGSVAEVTQGTLQVSRWDVSPDGNWIAFATMGRQEDLYLVRPDGSALRKLTDDLHKDRGVRWIDDHRLVFYSNRGGGYEIWTVRRDGSDLEQLTETEGSSLWMPHVSPDGKRMVGHNAEGTHVFELELEGLLRLGDSLHLAVVPETEGIFRGFYWSPDGTRILGIAVAPLETVVAIHDFRDSSFRVLVPPHNSDVSVGGWLPDGRRVLATAGGRSWLVHPGDGSWTELPVAAANIKLTRDGRALHFVRSSLEADIWLAELP
jgi:Tol biopolymer transport system component